MDESSRLHRAVDTHWWHRGKRRIVTTLVRRHLRADGGKAPLVFDVGCGVGDYGPVLGELMMPIGFERSSEGLRYCRDRRYPCLVQADTTRLPVQAGTADGVLALDLLEHVVDDEGVLREYFRCLRPGGTLLVTVPAHAWLWSDHDDHLGHVRRYRRRELADKVRAAGFTIIKLTYFNSILFPAIALIRVSQRMMKRWVEFDSDSYEPPPLPGVNRLLAVCFESEASWLRHSRFPWGSSLVCIANKPNGVQVG